MARALPAASLNKAGEPEGFSVHVIVALAGNPGEYPQISVFASALQLYQKLDGVRFALHWIEWVACIGSLNMN